MDEYDDSTPSPLRTALTVLLIVLVPLALGIFLAGRLLPRPQVGIVRLSYDIGSLSTYEIAEQLRVARENPAIQAVVVIINSPGGSAAFSEELFLDVLDTRRDLPVVASIDLLAASGAYYMAAAANEIYAKPTSAVGSVGVIATLPGDVYIEEDLLTTGPYKAFGGTRDGTCARSSGPSSPSSTPSRLAAATGWRSTWRRCRGPRSTPASRRWSSAWSMAWRRRKRRCGAPPNWPVCATSRRSSFTR
jgi:hypothetical protein